MECSRVKRRRPRSIPSSHKHAVRSSKSNPTLRPATRRKQPTTESCLDPFPPLPLDNRPYPRTMPDQHPVARPQSSTNGKLHTVLFKPEDRRLSFHKLSPFSVDAATEHLDGIKDMRVNKARNIVAIDTSSAQTKHALLATTTLCGIAVVPQLSTKEVKITGVVRGIDIPGTASDLVPHIRNSKEILEANRSGNSLFHTFAGSTLPEHIYLTNVCSPVQPTMPGPLQSYKCGRYNHICVTCRCEQCAATRRGRLL